MSIFYELLFDIILYYTILIFIKIFLIFRKIVRIPIVLYLQNTVIKNILLAQLPPSLEQIN